MNTINRNDPGPGTHSSGDPEVGDSSGDHAGKEKTASKKPNKSKGDSLKMTLYWVGGLGILLTLVVFGFYAYHFHGGISSTQNHWGVFGDFIGGTLNPILSLLGLLALLYTIYLQNEALISSKEELTSSNEELRLSRKELKQSNTTAEKQAEYFKIRGELDDLMRIIEPTTSSLLENGTYHVGQFLEHRAGATRQTIPFKQSEVPHSVITVKFEKIYFLVRCLEKYKERTKLTEIPEYYREKTIGHWDFLHDNFTCNKSFNDDNRSRAEKIHNFYHKGKELIPRF